MVAEDDDEDDMMEVMEEVEEKQMSRRLEVFSCILLLVEKN